MKTGELIEYLKQYDPESEIHLIIMDPAARAEYPVDACIFVANQQHPIIGIDVSGGIKG